MPDNKTNNVLELLEVPTRARTREEASLLEDISFDSSLKNRSLRGIVLDYMKVNNFALVSWYHYNGIKKSFENTDSALDTRESYKTHKPSLPRIIGIRQYSDY